MSSYASPFFRLRPYAKEFVPVECDCDNEPQTSGRVGLSTIKEDKPKTFLTPEVNKWAAPKETIDPLNLSLFGQDNSFWDKSSVDVERLFPTALAAGESSFGKEEEIVDVKVTPDVGMPPDAITGLQKILGERSSHEEVLWGNTSDPNGLRELNTASMKVGEQILWTLQKLNPGNLESSIWECSEIAVYDPEGLMSAAEAIHVYGVRDVEKIGLIALFLIQLSSNWPTIDGVDLARCVVQLCMDRVAEAEDCMKSSPDRSHTALWVYEMCANCILLVELALRYQVVHRRDLHSFMFRLRSLKKKWAKSVFVDVLDFHGKQFGSKMPTELKLYVHWLQEILADERECPLELARCAHLLTQLEFLCRINSKDDKVTRKKKSSATHRKDGNGKSPGHILETCVVRHSAPVRKCQQAAVEQVRNSEVCDFGLWTRQKWIEEEMRVEKHEMRKSEMVGILVKKSVKQKDFFGTTRCLQVLVENRQISGEHICEGMCQVASCLEDYALLDPLVMVFVGDMLSDWVLLHLIELKSVLESLKDINKAGEIAQSTLKFIRQKQPHWIEAAVDTSAMDFDLSRLFPEYLMKYQFVKQLRGQLALS